MVLQGVIYNVVARNSLKEVLEHETFQSSSRAVPCAALLHFVTDTLKKKEVVSIQIYKTFDYIEGDLFL